MNKQKLILPASILLGCIILGIFFYTSQIKKQQLIEKQKQEEFRIKNEQEKITQNEIKLEEERRSGIKAEEAKKDEAAKTEEIKLEETIKAEQAAKQDAANKTEIYRKECVALKEENTKKFEDFINTCTGKGGNSIDFCVNSDAGKILSNFDISTCIESKLKLLF